MNRETFKIIVRAFYPNALFKEWGMDYGDGQMCCCASITPTYLGCGLPEDTIACHSLSTFGGIGKTHIYDKYRGDIEDTETNLVKFLRDKANNTEIYLDD